MASDTGESTIAVWTDGSGCVPPSSRTAGYPGPQDLPLAFACPGCGYDLSAAAVDRCSECGRAIDERDLCEFIARDRYVRGRAGAWMLHLHVAAGSVVVMAAGAGLVGREPALAVFAALLTCIAFAAPAGLGWAVARFAREPLRPAYLTFWARSSWLLHAPWLAIPVCAVIVFIAAWIDSVVGSFVLAFIVMLGFGLWGLGALSCLLGWFELWHATRQEFGLRERAANLMYGFLALVTFCGSTALAIAGGALATEGARLWFRL